MALVNDDEIEEVRRVLPEHPIHALTAVGELLVQAEIDLPAEFGLAAQLPDRGPFSSPESWLELALDRLVNEHVAIREVQNPRVAARPPCDVPQLPDDLHRHEGFAG